jgi:hypothetical protein
MRRILLLYAAKRDEYIVDQYATACHTEDVVSLLEACQKGGRDEKHFCNSLDAWSGLG